MAHYGPAHKTIPIQQSQDPLKTVLVSRRYAAERRARSEGRSLSHEQPTQDCPFAQTVIGTKSAPKGHPVSIGHVYVEFLHQPRRKDVEFHEKTHSRASQT